MRPADGYTRTPEGLTVLADGISAPRRWDGIASDTVVLGVAAPASAPVLAQDHSAPDPGPTPPGSKVTIAIDGGATPAGDTTVTPSLTGTYYAYSRWMNSDGVFSSLSPISDPIVLIDTDLAFGLAYTGVPVPPPLALSIVRRQILRNIDGDTTTFYVDVDSYNLAATTFTTTRTDTQLSQQPSVLASDAQNTPGIVGTYRAYQRFVDELGSFSDLSPVSDDLTLIDADYAYGIAYSSVPVPTQANVVSRQILRNTAGQADVYYVDIDTTDLAATTFASTKFDTELAAGTAVPLFDDDGNALANAHGVPPDGKCVLASHLGRVFLAVDRPVSEGGVALTSGSAVVRGLNTAWTSVLAGRFLWVRGGDAAYEILSVDEANQTLTLTDGYVPASDPYARYKILPAPATARLIYYTQAGDPEAWPATNALEVQDDGDDITGLMVKGSFLFILESRHIYRYTFQSDPAADGFVFLSATRGCVNDRCWVDADGQTFMLDRAGVHSFDGDSTKTVSDPIWPLFRIDIPSDPKAARINWEASERFFAVHSLGEQSVRWFVCLSGQVFPRHAIAYSYRDDRWWIEEYDRPLSSGCEIEYESRRRVALGGAAAATYVDRAGGLDDLDPDSGRTGGAGASFDAYGLTDPAGGSWPVGLVGKSVTISRGTGVGQRRTIVSQSATRLGLLTPWLILPDSQSVYQVGGVAWEWRSGWVGWLKDSAENPRRVEVLFGTTDTPDPLTLRLYRNYSEEPVVWRTARRERDSEGFASEAGSSDLVATMDRASGFAQQRMDGNKENNVEGTRRVGLGLSGVSSGGSNTIYQVAIEGAQP